MILKKQTNNTVLADPNRTFNAKVTLNLEFFKKTKDVYHLGVSFSYLTDENDPSTIKYVPEDSCDDIFFNEADYISKETALGGYITGNSNSHEVMEEMIDKVTDDYLDTEGCYGLTSTDWTKL